jgi:glycosyl transferase-like sugar-binding protein
LGLAEDDRQRSQYMRHLIQEVHTSDTQGVTATLPRLLVQFWDTAAIPADVRECLDSWRPLDEHGFQRVLFDDRKAGQFIAKQFGRRYLSAFEQCRHPAMRCDYFRLCFTAKHGGFYVDADDVYVGGECQYLFGDTRLKLQPLCYDMSTGEMVPKEAFTKNRSDAPGWIFYVNNNPLIAPPAHPVIRMALATATQILLRDESEGPDIQSATGPGNLTASLVRHAVASQHATGDRDFTIVHHWDDVAVSRWPLSYRSDERNWRLLGQSE